MRHRVTFTRTRLSTRSHSVRCTERARPDENSDYREPTARTCSQRLVSCICDVRHLRGPHTSRVNPKKQAGEIQESWSDLLPCFTSKDLTATRYVTGLQEQRDNTHREGEKTLCRGEGDSGEGRHRQRAYSSCFAAFVGLTRCSCSLFQRASEPMGGFEDDLRSQGGFCPAAIGTPRWLWEASSSLKQAEHPPCLELSDEKEWSLPVVVAQWGIFRAISVHKNRDGLQFDTWRQRSLQEHWRILY
jgi:hypothetical protein